MNRIIYAGISMLTGAHLIKAVVTPTSNNAKTGPISQLWIIPDTTLPSAAVKSGEDQGVCGDCELRGGICYVNTVRMGPNQIARSKMQPWHGGYWPAQTRLGAYGDPAAIPRHKLEMFVDKRNLGYTRQWRHPAGQDFKDICMASVFTLEEREQAKDMGFRTYRIGHEKAAGEMFCPYPKVTCQMSGLCNGNRKPGKKDIVIPVHGTQYKQVNFHKLEV